MNASSGFAIGNSRSVHHYGSSLNRVVLVLYRLNQGSPRFIPAVTSPDYFAGLVGEAGAP
jgi:hypothetical protein